MSESLKVKAPRIVEDLRNAIRAGQYTAGAKLPSIAQLVGRYDTTKSTVQRAIDQLKAEGLVAGRQGQGVFVRAIPAGVMDGRRVRLAAFVVLVGQDDRVLLSHRRDVDVWDLPGGGADAGETPWQAAVRETLEETGLVVEIERLTGLYAKPGELVATFRARIVAGQLRPTDEADRHAWIPPDELPANISPNQLERISDALAAAAAPALRTQPGYSAARPQEWLADQNPSRIR